MKDRQGKARAWCLVIGRQARPSPWCRHVDCGLGSGAKSLEWCVPREGCGDNDGEWRWGVRTHNSRKAAIPDGRAPPPLSPFARLGTEKLLYIAPGFHFRPPVHFPLGMAAAIVRAALRPFVLRVAPTSLPAPLAGSTDIYAAPACLLRIHHPTSLPSSLLTLPVLSPPPLITCSLTHQHSLPCYCCSSLLLLLLLLVIAMSNPLSNVAGSFSYAIAGLALVEMMRVVSSSNFSAWLMRCDWGSLASSSAHFYRRRIVSESSAALAGFDRVLWWAGACAAFVC